MQIVLKTHEIRRGETHFFCRLSRLFAAFVFGALILAAAPRAEAQIWERWQQAWHGFAPERLERIDRHMENAIQQGKMVGGLGMIVHEGDIIYAREWGQSNRKAGKPMTEDTLFRIFSMTKPITSVAVMILVEEGKLRLDDPIAKHLPELANLRLSTPRRDNPNATIAAPRQPTVRDLLRHTAGFSYGYFSLSPVDTAYVQKNWLLRPDMDLATFTQELGEVPLRFAPGTRWHYSVATDVLGRLVEAVSGQSFGAFLRARIFEPLEMEDTFFRVPPAKQERFAVLYAPEGVPEKFAQEGFAAQPTGPGLEEAGEGFDGGYQPGAMLESGGGGLVSTAEDYLRFCLMLLEGGELEGERILSPQSISLMTSDALGAIPQQALPDIALPGASNTGMGFGLGFGVVTDRGLAGMLPANGTYFWGGAAGTGFWIDPKHELIGIFMTQSMPHLTTLREDFRDLTYQALTDEDDRERDD